MSKLSDQYEKDVANYINGMSNVTAIRPKVGTSYPDIHVRYKDIETWIEVKMNHTDNLANPRVYYDECWKTTYTTPVALHAIEMLNSSEQAKLFLYDIAKFSNITISDIKIPTTKTGLKHENAVSLALMKSYFNREGMTRYIAMNNGVDLGKMTIDHYTLGKAEPAYYMQAADDFYRVSDKDPFNFGDSIPLLSGIGDFKVRISTRSAYYEVQVEAKIFEMPVSDYSIKPNTEKRIPFK